ncbi:MAG: ArsA family ATPase [Deltaproteobacteria bacterium]|nr:ArsA family ATPase [Deltaproteobacteria bacterium]
MMRVIVYSGKGGVGKTTLAAATALRSADLGYKTLVLSLDILPTLATVLGSPVTHEPQQVSEFLWAQEISVAADVKQHRETLRQSLAQLSGTSSMNGMVLDDPMAFPGVDGVLGLFHINKHLQDGYFQRLIVDAPAAGEALRLLTTPDAFRWYADRLTWSDNPLRQILRSFANDTLWSSVNLFKALTAVEKAATELQLILRDPSTSSYRLVARPEKIIIQDIQRICASLRLFNYPIDGVIVNGVLPETANGNGFWQQRHALQTQHLQTLEKLFQPLPVRRVSYYAEEVVGLPVLSQLAQECFGDTDPGAVWYRGKEQEVLQQDGRLLLRIPLPFVTQRELRVRKRADRLFVSLGNFQREIILPPLLAQRKVEEGRLVDGMLEILFPG